MRTYTYRAILEPGDKKGIIVVSFPDVPEVITEGRGEAEALAQAEDALGVGLLSYSLRGLPLPRPKARSGWKVPVAADVAAKLAVVEAFVASGISKSELARRLRVSENEARRILDPMHATKLPRLTQALAVLGRRLVVGIEEMKPQDAAPYILSDEERVDLDGALEDISRGDVASESEIAALFARYRG